MNDNYLAPDDKLVLWKSPNDFTLFYKDNKQSYRLNQDAATILELCNGRRTAADIVTILKEQKPLTGDDIGKINAFLDSMVEKKVLRSSPDSVGKEMKIEVLGEEGPFHPLTSTVELCDACNLECSYCYREAGPQKNTFLENPIEFFGGLFDSGIRVLELSGGDPLMHPDIHEILEYVCEKFFRVALLTNGILLDETLLDILEKHRNKCSLQVSIQSMNRERFRQITGKDKWETLNRNLHALEGRDIKFRLGMVFHDAGAVDEFRDAAYFAKSLGALQFICTPFITLGRGKDITLERAVMERFTAKLDELRNEFPPAFLGVVESDLFNPDPTQGNNCGAGSRAVVYEPTGMMRPCPMMPAGEFSGLALADPKMRERMYHLVAPRQSICGECRHLPFCSSCFLRGWMRYKETNCRWGKSQEIDEVFDALKGGGIPAAQ